jgi:hypothetical protein
MIYIPFPLICPIVFRSSRGRQLIKGIENKKAVIEGSTSLGKKNVVLKKASEGI